MIDRHVAPAEQDLIRRADRALELLLARQARRVLLRQEHHADAVFADRRQRHALLGHLLAQHGVGDLDQHAGPVAHQRIRADGAAMIEVLQDQQTLLDDGMTLLAADVRDEADAARVVFKFGSIQTAPFGRRARIVVDGRALHFRGDERRHAGLRPESVMTRL
jgi:hypothetical protein